MTITFSLYHQIPSKVFFLSINKMVVFTKYLLSKSGKSSRRILYVGSDFKTFYISTFEVNQYIYYQEPTIYLPDDIITVSISEIQNNNIDDGWSLQSSDLNKINTL